MPRKFFLYTFLGSVLMLVALIYLYMKGGSFQLADLYAPAAVGQGTDLDFFAFLIAFAVKVPMAGPHLAAGRPRGSADRRFGGAGRHR
jgi:NADH-quinone oxidoreductase subunit M